MTDVETLRPPVGKPGRHRWGDPVRFPYKTERSYVVPGCGIVKVTRHEPGEHPWLEFYRGGERIQCDRTPECKGEKSALSLAAETASEVIFR